MVGLAYGQEKEFPAPDATASYVINDKSGFAFGGTPILAYDPDLGIRYGAVINLFDYGNGNNYPKYLQYATFKLFNSTKGTSNYSVIFDSEKLLPTTRITFEAAYVKDIALDFFGFNGSNSIYNSSFIEGSGVKFRNSQFYKHQRQFIRFRIDLQKSIFDSGWSLFSGINYTNYKIKDIDYDLFDNKMGVDGERITLYKV